MESKKKLIIILSIVAAVLLIAIAVIGYKVISNITSSQQATISSTSNTNTSSSENTDVNSNAASIATTNANTEEPSENANNTQEGISPATPSQNTTSSGGTRQQVVQELPKNTVDYASTSDKAIVLQEAIDVSAREFASAYYNFDKNSILSGNYRTSLESVLGYAALERTGTLASVRNRMDEVFSAKAMQEPAPYSSLVEFRSATQLATVHDGIHDHMLPVKIEFVTNTNLDSNGSPLREGGTREITGTLFLDSEYDVADYLEK